MVKYIGKSKDGVKRTWGKAPHAEIAETMCVVEAEKYIARRPDTAPITSWTFTQEMEEIV